ncbi:RING-H2 finger protein ATL57 [Diospyros lotus]|uniref:RING-H2 finger protein ATL57 n=1 Tax=Diospyros lotus TaxID=55363 RepID=UPI002250C8D6|nr:RING-H2 finger protein ATL57 [Diospyros lotus]
MIFLVCPLHHHHYLESPPPPLSVSKSSSSHREMKQQQGRKLLQYDSSPTGTLTGSSPPRLPVASKLNSAFDSSMALTALILLSALFFVGFLSIYIRHCAEDATDFPPRRRRRQSPPTWRPCSGSAKGLDPDVVRSLPVLSYGGGEKHPIDCAICLSEFEDREMVKMIPYCRHVFHPACIDTWLSAHVSCPLCRTTQMSAVAEVRLGLGEEDDNQGGSENPIRLTADDGDTRQEAGLGEREMRRVRIQHGGDLGGHGSSDFGR